MKVRLISLIAHPKKAFAWNGFQGWAKYIMLQSILIFAWNGKYES